MPKFLSTFKAGLPWQAPTSHAYLTHKIGILTRFNGFWSIRQVVHRLPSHRNLSIFIAPQFKY
ncbi:MAG: hypothetical protein SH821_17590 [Phototrophicales bacterium]|nr:hypothetical protein [Phototrophicales bacterium]